MNLKDLFPEWYSVVDPGFSSEKITHRLTSISKIAGAVPKTQLVDLVCLFYSACKNNDFIGNIRTAIKEVDDTYISHDQAELAIIAAGILYMLISRAGNIANIAALLLLCAEYGGLQGTKRVDAVVARAHEYLFKEGTRVREEVVPIPNITELLKSAANKLQAASSKPASSAETNIDPSLDIHTETHGALKSYAMGLSQYLDTLEKRRLEESGVLYWLIGGRTLISEEPFDQIDKTRLSLLAAHDLATHTRLVPGPASCRSILRTVIARGKGNAQQSSTKACIGKLMPSDGEKLLKKTELQVPIFMPLTFALEKNRENGWVAGWENAFSSQTKMAANSIRQLDEIAEQYYRESLLSRLLDKA